MSATVYSTGGRVRIAVTWQQSSDLYDYLRRNGIRATAHLNPAAWSAEIEPVEGVDGDRVRFLVARWRDTHPG
jgi:hypothetical protein